MTQDEIDIAIDQLVAGAALLGIDLDNELQTAFTTYCSLLLEHNRRFNLTALRTPEGIAKTLFLDSLTLLPALRRHIPDLDADSRVVDVGAGAGIPGLPLKLVCPGWELLLIEATAKKARFLDLVVNELGLENVTVMADRAETVALDPDHRDAADLCVARAVSRLASLIELCSPFVRHQGLLAFPKSGRIEQEVKEAAAAARAVGVEFEEIEAIDEELNLGAGRGIVLYRKVKPTPKRFPRRVGLAHSQPIMS